MKALKGNSIENKRRRIHKIMKDFKLEKDYEYDFQEDILTINASMYVEDYILLKKFLKYFKVYPLELRITPKEHKIHCEYVCAWYNIPGDKNE